jgi:hypothetical protein
MHYTIADQYILFVKRKIYNAASFFHLPFLSKEGKRNTEPKRNGRHRDDHSCGTCCKRGSTATAASTFTCATALLRASDNSPTERSSRVGCAGRFDIESTRGDGADEVTDTRTGGRGSAVHIKHRNPKWTLDEGD